MTATPESIYADFAREFIRRHEHPGTLRRVDRIVAATDFSLGSLAALEYAEELAHRFEAEVILVHAEEVLGVVPGSDMAARARIDAERELARTATGLRARGLRVRTILRPGLPAEEILHVARAEHASLIVMGTHGRSGLAHMVMGSVAERVVRAAPCPVLTVCRPR
jgi:nucleotide-binding universal stress UspA family protein